MSGQPQRDAERAEDEARAAQEALGAVLAWGTLIDDVTEEVERIEADYTKPHDPPWDPLDVASAWHGCNSALDDAKTTRGTAEQHRYLVRLAAWAMVALRAEARETSAKEAGHG